MATITVDTYLDGGTARTAGEAWTCNGGKLLIRTDTRYHANMPASMTGTLSSVTISATLGGGMEIDGTKVRWLAYNTGTGNVPAIGTNITQAGVSTSYLLGVYATITSAPTAVASAMPATGFIKFREVTGSFTSGALTGIGASATGADTVGWLEVVMDQAANITVPRLGNFTTTGKWFDLGTTNGAANQILSVPTHGSSTSYTPGVWIDDAAVSISNVVWSAGIATYTTSSNHGFTTIGKGDQRKHVFIQGITPSNYNFIDGTIITVTSATSFTVSIAANPGSYVSGGTCNSHTFYRAAPAADLTATNIGTDIRSQIVCMETNGSIRIGHNGTVALGFIPPTGRKVKIPNILLRECTTAARATNAIPHATLATRPDFTTTSAGKINISHVIGDWYFLFSQPYSVKITNSSTFETINISECADVIDILNVGVGRSGSVASVPLTFTSCFAGGYVTDFVGAMNSAAASLLYNVTSCKNIINTRLGIFLDTNARNASPATIYAVLSDNLSYYDSKLSGAAVRLATSSNCLFDSIDYCDLTQGTTTATAPQSTFVITAGSSNITIKSITFGRNGTITNSHPYTAILNPTQCSNIKLREIGTKSAPVTAGSANQTGAIFTSGGNNSNITIQRVYLSNTRTGNIIFVNSDTKCAVSNCSGDYADTINIIPLNSSYSGISGTSSVTGQTAVYGSHIYDCFTSDTAGRVVIPMNEPTATSSSQCQIIAGTPKFTSAGNLALQTVGDEVIWEQSYFALGHGSLSNTTPTVTGTNVTFSSGSRFGNHDLYYQIDTGSGYGGSWKNLNGTELSGETISPSTGFRLKIRAVCAIAATTNLLTFIRLDTATTLANQTDNLYPLDVTAASLQLTGLQSNSEVRIYRTSDGVELSGTENSGSSFTYNYTHLGTDIPITVVIHALNYVNVRLETLSLTAAGLTVPIQQQFDRVYENV